MRAGARAELMSVFTGGYRLYGTLLFDANADLGIDMGDLHVTAVVTAG